MNTKNATDNDKLQLLCIFCCGQIPPDNHSLCCMGPNCKVLFRKYFTANKAYRRRVTIDAIEKEEEKEYQNLVNFCSDYKASS